MNLKNFFIIVVQIQPNWKPVLTLFDVEQSKKQLMFSRKSECQNSFKQFAYHCVKYAKHGFSLTRIFPYEDRIYDSVIIRENMGQRKPVFLKNLHNIWLW